MCFPYFTLISMLTNLDETSDIHNFSSTVKVIEFVGIDPGTYQSISRTAQSKRGSRYLRKSLYQCILPVCTNNLTFNKYYKLKRL